VALHPVVAILLVEEDRLPPNTGLFRHTIQAKQPQVARDLELVPGVVEAVAFSAAHFENLYEKGPAGGGLGYLLTRFEIPVPWPRRQVHANAA